MGSHFFGAQEHRADLLNTLGPSRNERAASAGERGSSPAATGAPELDHECDRFDDGHEWGAGLCVKSTVHESGGVMVSVEDTGTGIDPKDIDQIFNPLFTTKSHGMGMGLSICRSIIEAHEGQLWASPNRSQGAVFQFTLPADTAMSAGNSAASPR